MLCALGLLGALGLLLHPLFPILVALGTLSYLVIEPPKQSLEASVHSRGCDPAIVSFTQSFLDS